MSYFDDHEFYQPEPSEADELFDGIMTKLREQVKQEIYDQIDSLTKTVQEQRTKLGGLEELEKAAIEAERKFNRETIAAKNEAKREAGRIAANDLLEILGTPKYTVTTDYRKMPKCERCNESRQLPYITPLGKKVTETCPCGHPYAFNVVEEVMVHRFGRGDGYDKSLQFWYTASSTFKRKREANVDTEDDYVRSEVILKPLADVAKMVDRSRSYGFDDKESAQALADHMNIGIEEKQAARYEKVWATK